MGNLIFNWDIIRSMNINMGRVISSNINTSLVTYNIRINCDTLYEE